jgi:hypothetical protein
MRIFYWNFRNLVLDNVLNFVKGTMGLEKFSSGFGSSSLNKTSGGVFCCGRDCIDVCSLETHATQQTSSP